MLRKRKGSGIVKTMSPQEMQRVAEGLRVFFEWLKRGKQTTPHQINSNWNHLPEVLKISEIAELLNISKTKAYNLCKHPDFPVVRIGRRILVRKDHLKIWLDKQTACSNGKTI
jgi:excisionase family DNA binding protein